MKLAAILMEKAGSGDNNVRLPVKTRTKTERFDSVLDRSEKTAERPKDEPISRRDPAKRNSETTKPSMERLAANQARQTQQATRSQDPQEEMAKAESIQKSPKGDGKQNNGEIVMDESKEVLEKLSEVLKLPVEDIMAILQGLAIQPLDLKHPENMKAFMQKYFDADSPGELLTIPGANEVFVNVAKVMEELDQNIAVHVNNVENVDDTNTGGEQPSGTAMFVLTEAGEEVAQEENGLVKTGTVNQSPVQAKAEVQTVKPAEEGSQGQELGNSPEGAKTEDLSRFVNLAAANGSVGQAEAAFHKAEAAKPINTADVVNQIAEKIKVEIKSDNITEIKISLRPESLGEVSLKVSTQNGIVTAQFVAESQRVKEVIEANLNQLKSALDQQGVNVAALNVYVDDGRGEQRRQAFERASRTGAGSLRIKQVEEAILAEEAEKADGYGDGGVAAVIDYKA